MLQRINEDQLRTSYHSRNLGKGVAIREGLRHVTGDRVVIQDADLEYSPEQYSELIKPVVKGNADVVFGSRFLGIERTFMFWHYMGNRFLTLLTNVLYNAL